MSYLSMLLWPMLIKVPHKYFYNKIVSILYSQNQNLNGFMYKYTDKLLGFVDISISSRMPKKSSRTKSTQTEIKKKS